MKKEPGCSPSISNRFTTEPTAAAAAPATVNAATASAASYKNNDVTDQSPVYNELHIETHVLDERERV